jgi:hypothetical protein
MWGMVMQLCNMAVSYALALHKNQTLEHNRQLHITLAGHTERAPASTKAWQAVQLPQPLINHVVYRQTKQG